MLRAHRLQVRIQEQHPIPQIAGAAGDNATSASMNANPLKVQIEYTDAKGERLTVDKDVTVPASGFSARSFSGQRGNRNRSSGLNSSLPYIVIIVIAGAGVFLYRKRKQGAKKSEGKASVK